MWLCIPNTLNLCASVLICVPINKEEPMPKVALQTPAPDFTLDDFQGQTVRLSDYRGQQHVVLVFNRGFT